MSEAEAAAKAVPARWKEPRALLQRLERATATKLSMTDAIALYPVIDRIEEELDDYRQSKLLKANLRAVRFAITLHVRRLRNGRSSVLKARAAVAALHACIETFAAEEARMDGAEVVASGSPQGPPGPFRH